ncbi:hypothetical protein [Spirosoma validum]|uniref:Lipoprotein n=1 Tax=Spirosoma validum TaxID=2771355 RepID=A0A927B588_9BACT|nr:hypothetical protein [Spirosoma validum]MBD2755670.1 hypothetical protein [Spirosoma validum]
MIRLILLTWLALTLGCKKDSVVQAGPERTEAAYIFPSNLAADGCEEVISLQTDSAFAKPTEYKPSPSTLPLVQKALKETPFNPDQAGRPVTIRFVETGNQVFLQCGWGSRREMSEIEVLEIKPR